MRDSIPKNEFKQLIKLGFTDWSLGTGELPNVIDYYETFMWFREVFRLTYFIDIENNCVINIRCVGLDDDIISIKLKKSKNYEDAQLACLKKLIEIVNKYRNGKDFAKIAQELLNQTK
jgi:hypothetical protein